MLTHVRNSLTLVLLKTQIKNIWHMAKVNIKSEKIIPFGGIYYASKAFYGSVENAGGTKTKNIKKHPFTDASASHLSSARWHVWFQAAAWIRHTTVLPPLSSRPVASPKGQKPLAFGETHNPSTTPKYASHGRDVILHVRHKWWLIIVSTAVRDNMKNHQFRMG